MASIKKRKSTFSVIYWYLDNAGERKQKWDTLETKKEACLLYTSPSPRDA